jgi:flagellar biosynthesis/type III secretory pathway M-ring protein FliF/YscJ
METQSPDSNKYVKLNKNTSFSFTSKNLNQLQYFNKNITKNNLKEKKEDLLNYNFFLSNNLNYLQSQQDQGLIPLSLEDKNAIIMTRLITSTISFIACFICILFYFYLCIRRTFENKKENKQKAEMMNKMVNGEDFDDESEENEDEKRQRFLTCEDHEHENEDKKELRLTLLSNKDNSEGVSFENVIAQNKSVSFEKNVYNPYSSNQSKLF